MAIDDKILKKLPGLVADLRELLTGEFMAQLQSTYGIQPDGSMTDLADLGHLDDADQSVAVQLRELVAHHTASEPEAAKKPKQAQARAVERTVREQAFTVLNRFAALRMAEERGLIRESVGQGMQSAGFKVYERVAGSFGGSTYARYRAYLHSLFDELALDLPPLFDRSAPQGLLFPGEPALDKLLSKLNQPALAVVWAEDEAIGWVYQFFNGKDEIKQMRDEGRSGPRNSREMAVRNQFFTPRYVVAFLVDNTLGRLWVEMARGQTDLPQHLDYFAAHDKTIYLEEDEAVVDADPASLYVPHRPLKDPREIRLLDPACGSMHFGLYAFDVFERIYLEAWDRFPSLFADLRAEGWDRDRFLRAVPAFILQHNLHGVDIDRRALQIAGLALWLRAQRAWQEQGVPPAERPRIQHTHLVCAEPMPGEAELLRELQDDLERRYPRHGTLLGELVEAVWTQMALAGEAGTLLRIEAELEEVVEQARREGEQARQTDAFEDVTAGLEYSVQDVSARFFYNGGPIRHVLRALHDLAERAEATAGSYQRRLFEDDAAQGFAFIELCRQRYDVIVMNPPFGDPAVRTKKYLADQYLDTKNDVLQAFVERAQEMLVPGGYLGAITSRTPFFLSSAQAWRERIVLRLYRPLLLADFGIGVLDAMVETAAYVLRSITDEEDRSLTLSLIPALIRTETKKNGTFNASTYQKARRDALKRHQAERELQRLHAEKLVYEDARGHQMAYVKNHNAIKRAQAERIPVPPQPHLYCLRLLGETEKGAAMLQALGDADDFRHFEADPAHFADVPGAPFAYWVSDRIRALFKELPPFESNGRTAKQGLATADDFRFVRCWWEVPAGDRCPPDVHSQAWIGPYCVVGYRWYPFAKGGSYSPFYADLYLVVNWQHNGAEIRNFVDPSTGKVRSRPQNTDYYFRPGLTWPRRTTSGMSFRPIPAGSIFADKGPVAFADNPATWLTVLQSSTFEGLVSLQLGAADAAARSYEVGLINSVPVPLLDERMVNKESGLDSISIKRKRAAQTETTHVFVVAGLMSEEGDSLGNRIDALQSRLIQGDSALRQLRKNVDEIASRRYGLEQQDVTALEISRAKGRNVDDGVEEEAKEVIEPATVVHNLIGHLLGVTFGRWDVRYATREREAPPLPDPFDPLPVCPPGMLQGEDGVPLDAPPASYPVAFPPSGLLIDDTTEAREDGLMARLRHVFRVIYGDRAVAIEQEAAELLGVKTLEDYLRRPTNFFTTHLRQYSKSRRKAPIYWPLQVPSGLYTVWVYYPHLSGQTLFTILQDHVGPRLETLAQDIARLRNRASGDRQAQRRLDDLVTLRDELAAFRDEVLRLTRLPYRPNLNDGVELSAAPMHALFQHTPWRRHLEKRWQELEDGDYDWAHLARTIWPTRVEEKCNTDRSLAIAHGLEAVYDGLHPVRGTDEKKARVVNSLP